MYIWASCPGLHGCSSQWSQSPHREEKGLPIYGGCVVPCGEDGTDSLLDQMSGRAFHLLSLRCFNGRLYVYLDQRSQLSLSDPGDGEVCPRWRFTDLIFAVSSIHIIMGHCIQCACASIWIRCTYSWAGRKASSSYAKIYYNLEGRAVRKKCSLGLTV